MKHQTITNALMVVVIIGVLIIFAGMAVFFKHWWIVLFSIFFIPRNTSGKKNKDNEQ